MNRREFWTAAGLAAAAAALPGAVRDVSGLYDGGLLFFDQALDVAYPPDGYPYLLLKTDSMPHAETLAGFCKEWMIRDGILIARVMDGKGVPLTILKQASEHQFVQLSW